MGADLGLFVDSVGDFIAGWTWLFCGVVIFLLVGRGLESGRLHKAS